MKKKTYKLKDISYMNLSLSYIALILVTLTATIVFVAVYSLAKKWLMMVVAIGLGGSVIFAVFTIGSKYGQYGLEILLGKFFQPKQLRNDFPLIAKHIVNPSKNEKTANTESAHPDLEN